MNGNQRKISPTNIVFAVIVGLALLSSLNAKKNGSQNSSSGGSHHGGIDTSESSRRRVTDDMVRRGSDPVEAEAFTKELYKAQREWDQNR